MCSPDGNVIAVVPTEAQGAASKLLRHSTTELALICDQVTKANHGKSMATLPGGRGREQLIHGAGLAVASAVRIVKLLNA